jgi:hypothetical protein
MDLSLHGRRAVLVEDEPGDGAAGRGANVAEVGRLARREHGRAKCVASPGCVACTVAFHGRGPTGAVKRARRPGRSGPRDRPERGQREKGALDRAILLVEEARLRDGV